MEFLWIGLGLALLVAGAELLVRGAVRLAEQAGVSVLFTGLVIVGFGTSTPEVMTSIQGSLAGSPGIAVGNIVGSNLFNSLVILGVAAMIRPLAVARGALLRDGVVMAALALAFVPLGLFWALDRPAGVLLCALLAGYLVLAWRQERAAAEGGRTAPPTTRPKPSRPPIPLCVRGRRPPTDCWPGCCRRGAAFLASFCCCWGRGWWSGGRSNWRGRSAPARR